MVEIIVIKLRCSNVHLTSLLWICLFAPCRYSFYTVFLGDNISCSPLARFVSVGCDLRELYLPFE